MKLYPAIDLLGGNVVRLREGRYDAVTVFSNDPRAVIERFVREGAERVHVVDLDGARDGAPTQASLVRALVAQGRVRVQVGGGIRTLAQLDAYASAGADRVVLGTAAVRDPEFVREACARWPVVVAVDARDGMVATDGWASGSSVRAVDLAMRAQEMGACAVLYTDIARDGTGHGPNVEATAMLARAVAGMEVIASGGVGSLDDLARLAERPEIAACVVGRALYDGSIALPDALATARAGR